MDNLQEEPRHADGKENFGMLPMGKVLFKVLELLSQATFPVSRQRRFLGDV